MVRVFWLLAASAAFAARPVETVWIRGVRPVGATGSVARIQPDVHSVAVGENEVVVRSAGISLAYLGVLHTAPEPRQVVREFAFRFPQKPEPATGVHAHLPLEYGGAFVNGVPIYNQFEAASYRGQNLWHYDLVARNSNPQPGLLEGLIPAQGKHSPIIGFALDGYPIYGPWGNGAAGLARMRSSYKLRNVKVRDTWPDGTKLAPGQYGPAVANDYPLGSFVEDYEYLAGAGDLDQYNGRWTKTPQYPDGTYAYFLATDAQSKLAFPYLLAHQFYGKYGTETTASGKPGTVQFRQGKTLQFTIFDRLGAPVRHLEFVHERPIHLLIVSSDLAEFDHVHPVVNEFGVWEVPHTFRHGGQYKLYAEFTAPGSNQRMENFMVNRPGNSRPDGKLIASPFVELLTPDHLRAGKDVIFQIKLNTPDLQPYLGAWAHIAIASEGLKSFIHAHPMEEGTETINRNEVHSHSAEALGLPPQSIKVGTSFPAAGLYKLWVQIQVAGKVEVAPFVVRVAAAAPKPKAQPLPAGAIPIRITATGFEPARVQIPQGKAVTLAFLRTGEPNCGGRIVFPSLNISRDVALGGVTLINLPAQSKTELFFTCGMGMYRGSLVIVAP